jgi:hypothetical protein
MALTHVPRARAGDMRRDNTFRERVLPAHALRAQDNGTQAEIAHSSSRACAVLGANGAVRHGGEPPRLPLDRLVSRRGVGGGGGDGDGDGGVGGDGGGGGEGGDGGGAINHNICV